MAAGQDDDHSTTPPEQPTGQTLGSIALRQVRVNRADVQERSKVANPMNRLVPYLDLYARLSDDELGRLASVPPSVVADLRRQVIQVDRALSRFTDLLPRLTDSEMVRLTGATPKTIRFWRLCQPRHGTAGANGEGWSVAQAAETLGRVHSSAELTRRPSGNTNVGRAPEAPLESGVPGDPSSDHSEARPTTEMRRMGTGTHAAATDAPRASESGVYAAMERRASESGAHAMADARRHATGEMRRHATGEMRRHATGERYRMPTAERDAGAVNQAVGGRVDTTKPLPGVPKKKPRTGRTQEVPAASSTPPVPAGSPEHPDVRLKQRAVSQQMTFSGAPFPGNDTDGSEPVPEDDGIFIGLELPDPRTLVQPGHSE